jgi:glycosyltransferase involved in cell wall biosynthesis
MHGVTLKQFPLPPSGRNGWPWTEESPQIPDTMPDGSCPPLVSIVTPSYNQGAFIEETIRSVLLQGYPNLEHIVIDGGSSDNTLDVLARYGDHVRWVSEPDRGQADAINKGLRMAKGEILAYLNSDDLYLPGAVQTVVEYFAAHPQVGLTYGDCQIIDSQGNFQGLLSAPKPNVKRLIHRAEFIPQAAAFWCQEVIECVGLLDESLHCALDHDFFIRIARAFPMGRILQPLACFRLHGVSKTVSQEDRHWREALAVSERYGMKPWTAWYWIRRLRHWGLRALPGPAQRWVRQRLGRPQDLLFLDRQVQ